MKHWVTRNGEVLHPRDMSDSHLLNARNHCQAKALVRWADDDCYYHCTPREYLELVDGQYIAIRDELARRGYWYDASNYTPEANHVQVVFDRWDGRRTFVRLADVLVAAESLKDTPKTKFGGVSVKPKYLGYAPAGNRAGDIVETPPGGRGAKVLRSCCRPLVRGSALGLWWLVLRGGVSRARRTFTRLPAYS